MLNAPASAALVSMTVWNHVGRLYMTAKLHIDTIKLAIPTSIGTFILTKAGGSTGSLAYLISTTKNAMKRATDATNGAYTVGDDHLKKTGVNVTSALPDRTISDLPALRC